MTFKTQISASLFALAALAFVAPLSATAAKMAPDMKTLDPDGDGTVSLEEAQKAAAAKFEMHDPDHDGTLDMKEAKGLMSGSAFKKADPDKDGTIDKTEYMARVDAAFKKADLDGDGTLDAKELKSAAGRALLEMIQ